MFPDVWVECLLSVLVINSWPKIDEARISVVTDGKCGGLCGFLADHVTTRVQNSWIG